MHGSVNGQLVCSRKVGERIRIKLEDGREIWITLVEVRHNCKGRIAVQADRSIEIMREELLTEIESPT